MNLLLFTVTIFTFYAPRFNWAFGLAFTAGLITDLVLGNPVGVSSLIFLSICFLVYLYRGKFSSSHFVFQLSFIFLLDFVLVFLKGQDWVWKKSLIFLGLTLIIFLLVNRIKGNEEQISSF